MFWVHVYKMKALFKTIYIEKNRICFKFGIGNANLKTIVLLKFSWKEYYYRLLKINKITILVLNKQNCKGYVPVNTFKWLYLKRAATNDFSWIKLLE